MLNSFNPDKTVDEKLGTLLSIIAALDASAPSIIKPLLEQCGCGVIDLARHLESLGVANEDKMLEDAKKHQDKSISEGMEALNKPELQSMITDIMSEIESEAEDRKRSADIVERN